ncbi:MAG: M23 family metallopeptidase [Magnetococcales bacterium]|nr:M23 family metallopeptidase [Magnetococcales bacterium]
MIRFIFSVCWFFVLTTPATAATLRLSAPWEQGTAVFLQVEGLAPGSQPTGTINDTPFPITPEGLALIALDMEEAPGPKTIRVHLTRPDGHTETLTQEIMVNKRHYEEEAITLPKGRASAPDPKVEERALRETNAIKATYRLRDGQVGFSQGFQQPITGRFSGVFGSRRIINGIPKRPHNGVDIAAPRGTPVPAVAAGLVALVGKDYFFTGNTIVIHHGHGVISLYAHLDTIAVAQGEWINQGHIIGKVGTTGRSTGPHLHWGMMVRGLRVDPMRLPGVRQE